MARQSNLLASIAAAATEATEATGHARASLPAATPVASAAAAGARPVTSPARRRRGGVAYAERNRPHTMMLPVELIERLNAAVERTGRSKAELVRTAVGQYLDELDL